MHWRNKITGFSAGPVFSELLKSVFSFAMNLVSCWMPILILMQSIGTNFAFNFSSGAQNKMTKWQKNDMILLPALA